MHHTKKLPKSRRKKLASLNNHEEQLRLVSGLVGLATLVLACLALAALISLCAWALALLASMITASVVLVAVWLCLDEDLEVLSRLSNSVNQDLITIWPFTLKLLLLVVLGKGLLRDFVIKKCGMCGFECSLAGEVCAFNFGVLVSADAVSVVVDGCLENYVPSHQLSSSETEGK